MKVFERRMGARVLECRQASNTLTLEGYASTFGQSYDMGWYRESVAAGAFKRTLGQSPDVRLLVNHDGLPLARTASGTLTLEEDDTGLLVRAELDATDPDVAQLAPKMARGDLDQMSFGFWIVEQDWSPDYDQRTIRVADLHNGDVSVVTYPANPNTSVSLRSDGPALEAVGAALRDLEARKAPAEDVVSVLRRALAYYGGDGGSVEPSEPAEARGGPSAALELRRRALALLG